MQAFYSLSALVKRMSASKFQVGNKKMANILQVSLNGCCLDSAICQAVDALRNGKVIAVPTDTIYGITALAQNSQAVSKLYEIKNRTQNKPVAICVSEITDIYKWANVTVSDTLLSKLLPGPVTLVFERLSCLNPSLNSNIPLVGIRIPNCPFIQKVAHACQEPLALTSANISSQTSSLAIEEFQELWPYLELIFNGGILGQCDPKRLGSTVVDLSQRGFYQIIRNGCAYEDTLKLLSEYGLKEINSI